MRTGTCWPCKLPYPISSSQPLLGHSCSRCIWKCSGRACKLPRHTSISTHFPISCLVAPAVGPCLLSSSPEQKMQGPRARRQLLRNAAAVIGATRAWQRALGELIGTESGRCNRGPTVASTSCAEIHVFEMQNAAPNHRTHVATNSECCDARI